LGCSGAPDKFNPKTRRSSAPAGMQLRFKIDKKKSGAQNVAERDPVKRSKYLAYQTDNKDVPLRSSASNDEAHPKIYVIGPAEDSVNPKSPRAKPTSPRDNVRHTPYSQTGKNMIHATTQYFTARSSRRHSIHTIESDSENEPSLLHLGTYSGKCKRNTFQINHI
jgi:hypothetical protein